MIVANLSNVELNETVVPRGSELEKNLFKKAHL